MLNSVSGFQRSRGGGFNRGDRFRSFNRFNDGDFDRDDDRFNEIIVFDNFGFPFFPFFGSPFYYPYPYYPYGYGYQSGYDGYGYQNGYGVNGSLVIQVQRRLASAGYYSGPIDGVIGSGTRRAIRAYERSHGLPIDGAINRRLLATMGLA
jgi:peptidoglycan hydrolase-like protein with peptidoglycan-binding domain